MNSDIHWPKPPFQDTEPFHHPRNFSHMPFPSQSLFSAPLPSPGNHYLDFLHRGLILPVLELHAKGTWSMYLVCLVSLVQHNVLGIYPCLLLSIPARYSFLFYWMHIPLFSYPYFSLMDICVVYRLLQIKSLYEHSYSSVFVVWWCLVAQLCPTLCDPINYI